MRVENYLNKRVCCSAWAAAAALLLPASKAIAGSGIFDSFVVVNTGSGNVYYDLGSSTGNPDWQGAGLGTFFATGSTNGGANLTLNGGQLKTYENSGDTVDGGKIKYRVVGTGGFTEIDLPFVGNGTSSGDRIWEKTNQGALVSSGLSPGNYSLEVFGRAPAHWSGGTFDLFVNNGGNNYIANFSVAISTFLWDGGNDTSPTSDASNWSNNVAPGNGHNIQFAGSRQTTVTSSFSSVNGITFNSGASAFSVAGSAIDVAGGGITNSSSNLQTISAALRLTANQAFAAGVGGLQVGAVDLNSKNLSVSGGSGTFSGNVTGSGNVTLSHSGVLRLQGSANSYSGSTTVNSGVLLVTGSKTGSGTVGVANSAALGGTGTIAGDVTISGSASLTGGDVGAAGKLSLAGNVTFDSGSTSHKFQLDIGSNASPGVTFDQIALTGSSKQINLNSTNLVINLVGVINVGRYRIIDATAAQGGGGNTRAGTFAGILNDTVYTLANTAGQVKYKLDYGSDYVDLTFTAVPEPTSIAFFGGLIGIASIRRNRRR